MRAVPQFLVSALARPVPDDAAGEGRLAQRDGQFECGDFRRLYLEIYAEQRRFKRVLELYLD